MKAKVKDKTSWPYSATAATVANKPIDWMDSTPESVLAGKREQWLKIEPADLTNLKMHFRHMWDTLPKETTELLEDRIAGRPIALVRKPRNGPRSEKDDILDEVEAIQQLSLNDNDLSALLKSVELKAKLHALLTQKEVNDPVITINVVSGVPRE
jgi:hypothetical protein